MDIINPIIIYSICNSRITDYVIPLSKDLSVGTKIRGGDNHIICGEVSKIEGSNCYIQLYKPLTVFDMIKYFPKFIDMPFLSNLKFENNS